MEFHFNIHRRNPGHWDIVTDQGRAFAIRGVPGAVFVRDERDGGCKSLPNFRSLSAAVAWCTDELMAE